MSDYKLGTCKWCRDKGDVYRDNGLCEDCDSDTVKCAVCRTRQHRDSQCRHVFQCEEFTWRGSGVNPRDEEMRQPFHRLLSAMGEEFARDLRKAIKSRQFYTWLVAPMIGGGGYLSLYGMPKRDDRWLIGEYGNKLISLGESDKAEDFADGYHWLVSLYKGKTAAANRTTIAWIEGWLWPFTPSAGRSRMP